jgi:hypothetical protein
MKLVIAGSRDLTITVDELDSIIKKHYEMSTITEIVSGCARGIDSIGILWANKNNIPVKKFIPDWSIGKAAGHIRNKQMAVYADQAIVIYNGSKGSQGMIDSMNKLNKPCAVIIKSTESI